MDARQLSDIWDVIWAFEKGVEHPELDDTKNAIGVSPTLLETLMGGVIRAKGVKIRHLDVASLPFPDVLGRSKLGVVEVRPLPPAIAFEALVHEFAHEILHWRAASVPDETLREFEAQAVSYEVSRGVGNRPLASRLTSEQSALLAQLPADHRVHQLAKNILAELHALLPQSCGQR